MLKTLLKEPLVHFLGLGLLVFAIYYLVDRPGQPQPDEIVVSQARIEQLSGLFEKTWRRPPTAQELKGLIDDYVKEEVLYREAVALGLDKDDTVVRRRMRQKMEFLSDIAVGSAVPSDAQLEAYRKANPERFERDPKLALEQIYLDPARHGDRADQDAASILEVLRTNPDADRASLGDPTLLPAELGLTSSGRIAQTFGPDFARAIEQIEPGAWSEPIKSSFGLHLVRIRAREPGRVPSLDEVRDAVRREWLSEQRRELQEKVLKELMKRYRVSIEAPTDAASRSSAQ